MRFLCTPFALSLALALPWPAQAQDFLTRAALEAHMREAVFCYHPDAQFACSWAELYTQSEGDHVTLHSGFAVWDEPMRVEEFRIEWRGDQLCMPWEDQGLIAAYQAVGYRFPFDLDGLERLPADLLPERIAELREGSPRAFCFRYTEDPDRPGQLLQYVFRDGVQDEALDPVALIPLFAGGVALIPS